MNTSQIALCRATGQDELDVYSDLSIAVGNMDDADYEESTDEQGTLELPVTCLPIGRKVINGNMVTVYETLEAATLRVLKARQEAREALEQDCTNADIDVIRALFCN